MSDTSKLKGNTVVPMNALTPIEREKTLGEHAYQRLATALMTGTYKPYEKITVRSVADALQVSITPARDAISRLISEGALENQGPKTVIVPGLDSRVLREVTKIRLALEGLAAEIATPNLESQGIKQLEETQELLLAAMDAKDYSEVLRQNEVFHFAIYQRSNMLRLTSIIESQWLRIGPSLNLIYPEFAISRKGANNHTNALAGLRRGEPGTVRAAIEKDIRDGFDTLERAIQVS